MGKTLRRNTKISNLNFVEKVPELQDHQFEYFRRFLFEKTGIRIDDKKLSLVSTRLSRRLRALNLCSWESYIAYLKEGNLEEIQNFVNQLTTNKSEFFRENKHFEFIEKRFLRECISENNLDPLFWVAACSQGQEVYSLNMVIMEFNRKYQDRLKPRILASDIDTEVLDFAQQGVYNQQIVEKQIPEELKQRYFLRGRGQFHGQYKFNESQRVEIKWRTHNLCDLASELPVQFDVILLRNVLIYFDPETVENILDKMFKHLKTGGYLIVGHCESIRNTRLDLQTIQQSVYRKK